MKFKHITFLICLPLFLNSCLEEFNAGTVEFEDNLVVEATLTDELKHQEISLSRTSKLENDELVFAAGATVQVIENSSITYTFSEGGASKYISDVEFMAMPDTDYQLLITTKNGREYASENVKLSSKSNIDDLYAEAMTNDQGVDGIGIFINSFDSTNNSKYYSYSYEETYKVVAPLWTRDTLVVISITPPEVFIPENPVPDSLLRSETTKVRYKTEYSASRVFYSTDQLVEDKVSKLLVRFIPKDSYIIRERYSVKINQLTHSSESYQYYKTLQSFSSIESVLSQTQPGFVFGNITSITDSNEKVVGYFDVLSVSSKRIFFEWSDFLDEKPPYIIECVYTAPALLDGFVFSPLIDAIEKKELIYYLYNQGGGANLIVNEGSYIMTSYLCGDCSSITDTFTPPDFWID